MSDFRMPNTIPNTYMGRLTRDPELKYIGNGTAVCVLGLAMSEYYKDRNTGEKKEATVFIDVEIWGDAGERCSEAHEKGHSVCVEGKLGMDSWEDKTTGQKRTKHKIKAHRVQALEWHGSSNGSDQSQQPSQPQRRAPTTQQAPQEDPPQEEDVPF